MINIFDEIKALVSFEGVAKHYGIEFGRGNKVLCPFHDEKTPSFSLHQSRLFAHCFGCDKSADVIDLEFEMGKHNSQYEAALALNERYSLGLKVNSFDMGKAEEVNRARSLLDWFCSQANQVLLQNREALTWLESKKGITIEDVKKDCIGYIGKEGLSNESVIERDKALALTLGLFKERDGKIYQPFRSRLVFPVWERGKIRSIWTRQFPDGEDTRFKWLGLPNTEIVPHKPVAWSENLNCKECLIVEGITDAIAYLKFKFPSCALLGKEISQENQILFERAKAKLIFALDPDQPGQDAAYKLARKFKGYILNLGYDKDPDEVLAELGPEQFKAVVENGIGKAKFYLDAVIEREGIEEVLKEIASLKMASEQDVYLNKLTAKHKDITIRSLRKDLNSIKNEKEIPSNTATALEDPKRKLHPAMDFIEGNLVYGTYNGTKPFYICNREIIEYSNIASRYSTSDEPQHLRFSADGIRAYLNGEEAKGPELYENIKELLSKHLIFRLPWQAALTSIWIIGTYMHRCFSIYPYLNIQSPTKRCGKTRLLEVISELAFNSDGIQTAPTQAVLYRLPAITGGTLCWDEAENLHNNKEKPERLEILNCAYRKGLKIARCEGEENKVRFFEVYRPVALAGINTLPDTVADRSIKIELIRKNKNEKVSRLQTDRMQSELQNLRDELHIFALEKASAILTFYDEFREGLIPENVDDRLRDALEILYSIAAGIYYPDKVFPLLPILKEAAKDLGGIRESEEEEISFVRAISILGEEFRGRWGKEIVLTSKDAVQIFQNGGLDWVQEPKHAKGILRKLGIRSEPHRIGDKVIRGYKVEKNKIEDLSKRYEGDISEKKAYNA